MNGTRKGGGRLPHGCRFDSYPEDHFMRTLLSRLFYWLGDFVCWSTELLARVPRCPEWPVYRLYGFYGWLMGVSGDLDIHESVWLHRRKGETEEAFGQRCRERWPDRD